MKKICIVVFSRANYSSIKAVMRQVQDHPDLQLQLVIGASALLDRFGAVADIIKNDGFTADAKVHLIIEGETPVTMAKSAGLGLLELPTIFDRLQPDVVLSVGDRFETLSTAIAASYMNIPVAHTMGGEISGTIDESIRHAVTKLSHLHFPASKNAQERIIRMGEIPAMVHLTGCPRIDIVKAIVEDQSQNCQEEEWLLREGVGGLIDFSKPFILMSQHPVTTEYGLGEGQIAETLSAVLNAGLPVVGLWPNADAGSEDIARGIRKFREKDQSKQIRFYKHFPFEVYIRLMNRTACLVGNSSAGIREGAFLGVPVVNVGSRQSGRERSENVMDADYEQNSIFAAIKEQLKRGRYESDPIYGDGHAAERIAHVLSTTEVNIQKKMTY